MYVCMYFIQHISLPCIYLPMACLPFPGQQIKATRATQNEGCNGYTVEERRGLTTLLEAGGMADTFRDLHRPPAGVDKSAGRYSWWSYRWLYPFLFQGPALLVISFCRVCCCHVGRLPSPRLATRGDHRVFTRRSKAREKNIGWRLDYVLATTDLMASVTGAEILDGVHGSDHCPCMLDFETKSEFELYS